MSKKKLHNFALSLSFIFMTSTLVAQSIDEIQQQQHQIRRAKAEACASCIASSTKSGTITPTTLTQSVTANAGTIPYWSFNATAGTTYVFSTCGANEDTYLEVAQNSIQISYNDDSGPSCSGSTASMKWLCTTTGTYQIVLSHYGCSTLQGTIQMAYSIFAPPLSVLFLPIRATLEIQLP